MHLDRPVIARLPEILINQIAAGEVVERPASALKELIENSLDAGATRIDVLLKGGGIEEMTIVDNGCGMIAEDLLLCIERHATSKIRSLEELEAVGSYGFRGEALSSIASVSRLEIVSRVAAADAANCVEVDFGVAGRLRPAGAPVGTRVTVRDLFAKLPARQKFLRTPGTEFAACARTVRELALGNPGVDFFLHHQNRRVADYVGPTREDRFREGFKAAWPVLHGAESTEGAALEFFLSPPEWVQDRGELVLFLNGRTIKNRNLIAAVRNAYLTTLGPHHEPSGVVYLDLRPEWVDVNVHPQKLEVRCLRQETLYPWILSSVRKAISQPLPKPPVAPPVSAAAPIAFPPPIALETRVAEPTTLYAFAPEPAAASARFLGVAAGRYLICEDGRGVAVIDTRAAARRARLGELRQGGVASQPLLVSQLVRLPLDLTSIFEDNADCLKQFGFEAEPFGDGDYSLKSVPAGIDGARATDALLALLRALFSRGDEAASEVVIQVLAELTCPAGLAPTQALAAFENDGSLGYRIDFATLEKHFRRASGETT